MKHYLIQYRLFRKIYKGTFFYLYPIQLNIAPFWSDKLITSCQTKCLKIEQYH